MPLTLAQYRWQYPMRLFMRLRLICQSISKSINTRATSICERDFRLTVTTDHQRVCGVCLNTVLERISQRSASRSSSTNQPVCCRGWWVFIAVIPTTFAEIYQAEDMEFSECRKWFWLDILGQLLTCPLSVDAAVAEPDPHKRIAFVAAFAMSNYSSTIGRIAKPFNPMLVRPNYSY